MCLVFLASGLAIADTVKAGPLKIESPVFGGSGCSAQTTAAKVQPGDETADIIGQIQPAVAHAAARAALPVSESCNLTVPVEVPVGYQASLAGAQFEGGYSLPGGAKVIVRTERGVSGGSDLKRQQKLAAPADGLSGSFESELNLSEVVWTDCKGGAYRLRSNLNVAVQNSSNRSPATFSLGNPEEKSTQLLYKVQWRKCQG